ncbi:DUF6489 family protein [Sphingomonas sp. 28-62-20]|uniref:DUF6489 family protein n=1 Tax=Sphingomonas sp. 28-62-20 TaxID=1970433 RepID=UPI0026AAF76D
MKINVEVECTPEEARRFMGLPDLTPLHEKYVGNLLESMDGTVKPEMIEAVMRSWAPMGEAGMTFWRQLFDGATKPKS